MILTQILQPECVKVPLENTDNENIIEELVDTLSQQNLTSDKDKTLEAVMTREKTRSTGIGSGIAIPHGKTNTVKELVMAIGIAKEPVDFESVDGKPVSIILLLVSPTDKTGPHIQALAKISKLMLDEDFKQNLLNAENPQQAYDLISSKEEKE
jgi:fructose-specific phosphotransferase system IIA component